VKAAVGLELWSMSNGIVFDNFIITDNKRVADQWAADGWQLKQSEEGAAAVSRYVFSSFQYIHWAIKQLRAGLLGSVVVRALDL